MNMHLFKMVLIACVLSFLSVDKACAQVLQWDDFLERLASDDETYNTMSYLYDDLCELHENPLNINTASTEELAQLPFLTAQQIEELQAYVYSYGPMRSLGELNLIKAIDYETRALLPLFIYCGERLSPHSFPTLKNLAKYGKHEVLMRTDVPFYQRAAYKQYSDSVLAKSPNKVYQGSPLYHSLRYQFHYGQKLSAGVVMEKDAGEPFFKGVNKAFDNYAYYFVLNNIGLLKTLAVGHYRLNFGQGLVMNTNFSLGKQNAFTQFDNLNKGIKKHASTSETNHFQGVAVALRFGKLTTTAFYSHQRIDATIDKNQFITSFKTDGYHRTLLEISKKNNTVNELIGGNLTWSSNGLHMGLTTTYAFFNRVLKPADAAYKRYYPRGHAFGNASLDYAYYCHRFSFSGETAVSDSGAIATLNALQYHLSDCFSATAVYRYYAPRYNSLYGSAFSEGGDVKNESGLYIGVVWKPNRKWKFTSYVDYFRFPWLKYQVSKPSSKGIDLYGQLNYTPTDDCAFLVRYRCKVKQKDYKDATSGQQALANNVSQTLRLQADYGWGKSWMLRTSINATQLNVANGKADIGYALMQQCTFKPLRFPLQSTVSCVYFHTDSYNSRVYASEKGLLYSFSFPSYYYHGFRATAHLRYDINPHCMCIVKYGHTCYFNKQTIGSAQDLIEGSVKQDLYLQLRFKF